MFDSADDFVGHLSSRQDERHKEGVIRYHQCIDVAWTGSDDRDAAATHLYQQAFQIDNGAALEAE